MVERASGFWPWLAAVLLVPAACSRPADGGDARARGGASELRFARAEQTLKARGARHEVALSREALRLGPRGGAATLATRFGAARALGLPPRDQPPLLPEAGHDHVEIDRGWAVERLSNRPDGVEQSWRLQARPPVPALELRIPIEGAVYVGRGRAGLVFRTAEQSYLTYGDAFWIDASGRRTHVPARYDAGTIALTVTQPALDGSTYPAVLDPVIGVEWSLTPTQLSSAVGGQTYPGIALGTTSRLVAWSDDREGVVPAVYATLRDDLGPITARAGMALGRGRVTGTRLRPAVAFQSSVYLVAWATYDTVYYARVDETGAILDSPARAISVSPTADYAAVAARDGNFLVGWVERGTRSMRAARVSTTGALLDATPILISDQGWDAMAWSLRASPDGFWAVFDSNSTGDRDIRLVRLGATGTPIDSAPVTIVQRFADQSAPDVAFGGGGALVVWSDSSTLAIHGAQVTQDAAGALTIGTETRISPGSGERAARIVWNGSAYQVAWISSQPGDPAPQVALLATGPARADGVTVGPGWANIVDIAVRGTTTEVVFDTNGSNSFTSDVFRRTGTSSNSWPSNPVRVSQAADYQYEPRIANNSSRSLVAWRTPTPAGADIYAARVNPLGEFEDATPIRIRNTTPDKRLVGVYSNGDDFLIAWYERDIDYRTGRLAWRIVADHVSDAGVVTSTSPIQLRNFGDVYVPAAAIWIDSSVFPPAYVGNFVDGDVIYRIPILANDQGASRFLFEADSVINCTDMRATSSHVYYRSTSGAFYSVTQTTAIQGGTGASLPIPSTALSYDVTPTSSGDVFVYYDNASKYVTLYGSGAVNGARVAQVDAPTVNPFPRLTSVPNGFLVAWNASGGILGRRLTTTGQMIDPAAATISNEPAEENIGDTHTDFADRVLVAYSRPMFVPGKNAIRVATRAIDFRFNEGQPVGGGCTTGFGCSTGLCVDGVCCQTACGYSNAGDCQACSIAAGGSADGTCTIMAAGAVCRAQAGECDVAELCDGVATTCPSNALRPSGTACGQPSAGPCDLADVCSGASATCQALGLASAGTPCRDARGGCDQADTCDGTTAACDDRRYPSGHACRPVAGTCDVAETCDGNSDGCPADVLVTAGAPCRPVAGDCDVAESCSGTSGACPPDAFVAAGTTCRASAGDCDLAESCTGAAAACPSDRFAGPDRVCRPATGACDGAESCSGSAASCPPDLPAADGTSCDDSLVCNGVDVCQAGVCTTGTPPTCPGDRPCNETAGGCVPPPDAGLGADSGADAARPDAGAGGTVGGAGSAGGAGPPPPKDGCGCALAPGGATSFPSLAWLGLAAGLLMRRRRR